MTMKFTILGCGSSSGVPRITGDWGDADPNEPKNRRQRCALLVEKIGEHGNTTIVIDTGPDFHQQMIKQNIPMIDAALITHEHADHTHGMDDLRAFAQDKKGQIDVYMTEDGRPDIDNKFGYCFHQLEGSIYPAILNQIVIDYDQNFTVSGAGGDIEVKAVRLNHGRIYAAGFLINGVMYSPDVHDIPKAAQYAFENLDIWIVDALRPQKHVSHFNYDDAIGWIDHFKPKKSYLTNMTGEMDYQTVTKKVAQLEHDIEVCYDGLSFEVED